MTSTGVILGPYRKTDTSWSDCEIMCRGVGGKPSNPEAPTFQNSLTVHSLKVVSPAAEALKVKTRIAKNAESCRRKPKWPSQLGKGLAMQ